VVGWGGPVGRRGQWPVGRGSPATLGVSPAPNKALERTGQKLALFPRRSPPALGAKDILRIIEENCGKGSPK
jgi:hypothetical protein